jgi:hypothetical protein
MKAGQAGAAREYVLFLFLLGKIVKILKKKDNLILFFFCFSKFAEDISTRALPGRGAKARTRIARTTGRERRTA